MSARFWTAAASLAMACFIAVPVNISADEASKPTVSVTGRGEVELPPDRALVRLVVSGRDESISESRRKMSERLAKVLTALKDAGMPDEAIKRSPPVASIFQAQPTFSLQGMQQAGAQKVLSVNLTLTIDDPDMPDLEKVWKYVGAALDAGAEIQAEEFDFNPLKKTSSFTQLVIKDPAAAKAQATRKAAEDAAKRGQIIAEGLGRKLGPLLSASECGSSPQESFKFIYDDSAPAPDDLSTVKITSEVTIRYALE